MSFDPRASTPQFRTVNPLGIPLPTPVQIPRPEPRQPQLWECADKCGAAARTVDRKIPHHQCPAHGGVMLPLVHSGQRAAYVPVERPDYVGRDIVQPVRSRRNGKLLMAVETHRDDGYDTSVFAPTATADADDIDPKGAPDGDQ